MCVFMYMCVVTSVCTFKCDFSYACYMPHTCIHTCIHMYICTRTSLHMYICTCAYVCMYIHIDTYIPLFRPVHPALHSQAVEVVLCRGELEFEGQVSHAALPSDEAYFPVSQSTQPNASLLPTLIETCPPDNQYTQDCPQSSCMCQRDRERTILRRVPKSPRYRCRL